MDSKEAEKLMQEIIDCGNRYDEAVKNLIQTSGSVGAIEDVKRINDEYQLLYKKYQDCLKS